MTKTKLLANAEHHQVGARDSFRRRSLLVLVLAVGAAALAVSGPVFFPQQIQWHQALLAVGVIAVLASVWIVRRARGALARQDHEIDRLSALSRENEAAELLANLGTWVHDLAAEEFFWSDGTFAIFGIDPADGPPSPRGFQICIHAEDQERWREAHKRAVRKGTEARIEYRYVRQGLEVIWIRSVAQPVRDEYGTVVRLQGIVQDISGVRAMQRQLAASETKYRELATLSSDWIWETDAQHRLSSLSDSIDAVLGSWARATIGERRWDIAGNELLPVDWEEHRRLVESHQPFTNFEYTILDPQRNVHHISLNGRPVFDEGGRFLGYRGTGQNITREKQQRMLLELDGEIARIMREQVDPQRVLSATVVATCAKFSWLGGAHLLRTPSGIKVAERWGYPSFTRMIGDLPESIELDEDDVEMRCWTSGKAIWLSDMSSQRTFSERYQVDALGARASLIAPILDEHGNVFSALLFLCSVSFRGDTFLRQVAEVLSRTLSLYLQRTTAEQRLLHASQHDPLTNLPNRAYVSRLIEEQLAAFDQLAVLYIDLDRYKTINDTLGHAAGDRVLVEVARRLRAALRERDVIGRMGGDEFVALLPGLSDNAHIERIARGILTSLEKPFVLNDRAYFLSASIGAAISPNDGSEAHALIRAADAAMYQVKDEGRNDLRFSSGEISGEHAAQIKLASELPLAIQRGEVDLYYQPIIDVGKRTAFSIEALLRWRHPKLGLLLPERFLPAAERNNMIREIGFWAIRRAIDDRIKLGLESHGDLSVSVNVSVRQLAEDNFLEFVNELLNERNFPARLLRLEITESAFMDNPERTVALISELRRIGVRVIVDNFGTGYAALSYLKNLPVNGLKIDRAFVTDLAVDRGNAAITQAITTLAAKLGLEVLAEGVETSAELRELRSLGCDLMQGSLISPAIPISELEVFLASLPNLRRMHQVGLATPPAA
ncbi:MAG: EAL domain-containing protein [Burkholderiaceae bacterium]|nr:EAL domain-containing protein [Burkholderiaceae bacterium]